MNNTLIEAKHLTVIRQGKKHILEDVAIRVDNKDFITIIGPNGAGKSMLLKCLMKFYPPDNGTIKQKSGLKIGYLPQQFFSDHTMPMTVKHFLMLRKKTSELALQKTAEETNIATAMHKPLSALSGGELQRVLLARALLDNPELLVLDEPAQNLDISGQLSFYKLLNNIYQERNLSILMVSHDLHMVMTSTKQVVCLFHHICCSGEPQSVAKDPAFISLFGNDMARMMTVYQHSHNHTHYKNDGDGWIMGDG